MDGDRFDNDYDDGRLVCRGGVDSGGSGDDVAVDDVIEKICCGCVHYACVYGELVLAEDSCKDFVVVVAVAVVEVVVLLMKVVAVAVMLIFVI